MTTGERAQPTTVIIDAGVGNLGNLRRALRLVGADAEITRDPQEIAGAQRVFLPGVGAFQPPREKLRGEMEEALRQALDQGAWLLGICVGFQLLFEEGEEYGRSDGLGLLPGVVSRLPDDVPLPHIGWNRLQIAGAHPLLQGLENDSYFYFVHSFAPLRVPTEVVLGLALHGASFAAVAGLNRVFGTQFHPEKSGRNGLRLLSNFMEMSRCN